MLETPQDHIVVVAEVAGDLQAEMLRGLLEAQGIRVVLSEESAARTYGINLPGLGLIQVLVRADQAEAARQVLEDYGQGGLEVETDLDDEGLSEDAANDPPESADGS